MRVILESVRRVTMLLAVGIAGFGPLAVGRDRSWIGFFTIDPTTLAGEFLGEVGPPNPNSQWEYRSVVTDGDWIYGRVGHY